jgi:tetratricopeptide (TPR) repeat protein
LPAAETSAAYFREHCLNCHAKKTPCTQSPEIRWQNQDNCIACHMPRRKTVTAHLAATDHRVPRRPRSTDAAAAMLPPMSAWESPLVVFHQNLMEPGDPEVARALGVGLMDLAAGSAVGDSLKKELAEHALPLLKRAPEDAVTWEAQGDALQCLGRLEEALTAYESAIAKAPWRDFGLVQASRIAERQGRLAAALNYSQGALALRPRFWLYHYKVARLQVNAQNWTGALAECEAALRLNPFSGDARQLQVQCLLASGKKEQARRAFQGLRAILPGRADELRRQFAEQLR